MSTRHALAETTLGSLTIVASDAEGPDAIIGLYFPGHWYLPPKESIGGRVELAEDPLLQDAADQVREYLAGDRIDFDLRLAMHGTPIQEQVWAVLKTIPFGATTTYGEIATQLGDRTLAQSVGQAVGHNPISIIVPCHRVVGAGGKLTGYAGGLERKATLLALEEPAEVAAARLF